MACSPLGSIVTPSSPRSSAALERASSANAHAHRVGGTRAFCCCAGSVEVGGVAGGGAGGDGDGVITPSADLVLQREPQRRSKEDLLLGLDFWKKNQGHSAFKKKAKAWA